MLKSAISRGQDVKALIKISRLSTEHSKPPDSTILERISSMGGVSNGLVGAESSINPNELSPTSQSMLLQHNAAVVMDSVQLNRAVVIESNLCHQVALIVMNILSLILIHHKDKLVDNNGDNSITKRLMDIYFYLLQSNQSEMVKLKVFASLRVLVNRFPAIFFEGHSSLCASLCLETLKCLSSKFARIRSEACVVIYLLSRKNYEHTKNKSIPRVHSQVVLFSLKNYSFLRLLNH